MTPLITSLFSLLPLLAHVTPSLAASADEWRSRSVYQVMTDRFAPASDNAPCNTADRRYCGGTWATLESKLDYIQNLGFDAVWISSTGLNLEGETVYGEAYHGFWVIDPITLNPHFGDEKSLKSLSAALHSRGMYLMVDIAINALASTSTDTSNEQLAKDSDGKLLFKQKENYHDLCDIHWGDHESEKKCWLTKTGVALMDLNQDDSNVTSTLLNWVPSYVSEYGIDGFRMDASKHMTTEWQHTFCSTAGVFCIGEVAGDDTSFAASFQGSDALDSVFGFGMLNGFVDCFTGSNPKTMATLAGKIKAANAYSDPTVIGSFLDNQDLPRFNSLTSDPSLVYNAIVGTFMYGGIPTIYYGLEQEIRDGPDDPANREALWLYNGYSTETKSYQRIKTLNAIRKGMQGDQGFLNSVGSVKASQDNDIAISRGKALIVLTNRGQSGTGTWSIPDSGFAAGSTVVDLLSCKTIAAGGDGSITVTWTTGEPFVFVASDIASSAGLCGSEANPITSESALISASTVTSTSTSASAAATFANPIKSGSAVAGGSGEVDSDSGVVGEKGKDSVPTKETKGRCRATTRKRAGRQVRLN